MSPKCTLKGFLVAVSDFAGCKVRQNHRRRMPAAINLESRNLAQPLEHRLNRKHGQSAHRTATDETLTDALLHQADQSRLRRYHRDQQPPLPSVGDDFLCH